MKYDPQFRLPSLPIGSSETCHVQEQWLCIYSKRSNSRCVGYHHSTRLKQSQWKSKLIQQNLNLSWTTMATRKSKRLGFMQYGIDELKILWQNKRTFAFKTIPSVSGIKRGVAWALSIDAIGILIAFLHFIILWPSLHLSMSERKQAYFTLRPRLSESYKNEDYKYHKIYYGKF